MGTGMTSPDLPTPVDLTLHSVTETQLIDAMLTSMRLAIPEWEPQEGATEVVLMEAAALVMGQFVFALNQLPRITLDGLVAMHGYTRRLPVVATGQVTITAASGSVGSVLLPAGARFRVDLDSGETTDLLTAEDTTVNTTDSLTANVHVVAAEAGAFTNGIVIGTPAVMVDSYTWIESAVVSTATGGGADAETDETYYARTAASLAGSANTLVVDSQFQTTALANNAVGRARAYSLWDGVGTAGTMQGHVAIAISAADGTDLGSDVKDAVRTDAASKAVAGLQIHVIDFLHVAMTPVIVYNLDPRYAEATVSVAIEKELRTWLNPATWPLGDTLTSVNQVILRLGRVPGVQNVVSVTGWSPITGGNTLPSIASISITVA